MDVDSSIGDLFAGVRDRLTPVLDRSTSADGNDPPTSSEPSDGPHPDQGDGDVAGRALRSFDERILHPDLVALCRLDFHAENYADASRRATQYLSQEVLDRCRDELQRREHARASAANREPSLLKDGSALMEQVFSVGDPVLLVPPSMETESDRSEQLGYGSLMKGAIAAFRNPRSHDVFFEDDPLHALLIIELVQHLLEVVANSNLVERPDAAGA